MMCKSPDVPLQDELLTRTSRPPCYSRLTNITYTAKLINTVAKC